MKIEISYCDFMLLSVYAKNHMRKYLQSHFYTDNYVRKKTKPEVAFMSLEMYAKMLYMTKNEGVHSELLDLLLNSSRY